MRRDPTPQPDARRVTARPSRRNPQRAAATRPTEDDICLDACGGPELPDAAIRSMAALLVQIAQRRRAQAPS